MVFRNSTETCSSSGCVWPSDQGGGPLDTVALFGLNFANVTMDEAVAWLARRPPGAPFGYVVTPNSDHLVRMRRLSWLRHIYDDAALRLLDSRVVARGAKLLGLPAPPVVPGSDLTARLVGEVISPNEPVTIVGMTDEAMVAFAERSGLRRIAHHNPPMGFDEDPLAVERAVRFIEEHPARFTFIAVGEPRQCRLAYAVKQRGIARGVGLCIGASLLFLSGHERRAPLVVQQAGLEWAWRLGHNPRRLARRYLLDSPRIVTMLLEEARSLQRGGAPSHAKVPPEPLG